MPGPGQGPEQPPPPSEIPVGEQVRPPEISKPPQSPLSPGGLPPGGETFAEKPTNDLGSLQEWTRRMQDANVLRQAMEGGGSDVTGQGTENQGLFEKPTNDADTSQGFNRKGGPAFGEKFMGWLLEEKGPVSSEEQKAFEVALVSYMESISGKRPSPEAVQRITEALERKKVEDEAREEGEKQGIAKGAVGAMLEILGRPEFKDLFPPKSLGQKPTADEKVLDWLRSKISPPSEPENKTPPAPPTLPSGGNPGK